jgi:hypothetical protein
LVVVVARSKRTSLMSPAQKKKKKEATVLICTDPKNTLVPAHAHVIQCDEESPSVGRNLLKTKKKCVPAVIPAVSAIPASIFFLQL